MKQRIKKIKHARSVSNTCLKQALVFKSLDVILLHSLRRDTLAMHKNIVPNLIVMHFKLYWSPFRSFYLLFLRVICLTYLNKNRKITFFNLQLLSYNGCITHIICEVLCNWLQGVIKLPI